VIRSTTLVVSRHPARITANIDQLNLQRRADTPMQSSVNRNPNVPDKIEDMQRIFELSLQQQQILFVQFVQLSCVEKTAEASLLFFSYALRHIITSDKVS
jgi:hypothetical protein